jgi:cytochrome c oxidase subunit 1
MSAAAPGAEYHEDYLREYTLESWLFTTDHKRIGLSYMASITFFFVVGGVAATVMRLELMTPRGDVLFSPDAYNRLFTMHGVVMIFFFLIPSIPAVLGNFLIPLMIGARDLAFPRLNLLSWYIYMIGGLIALVILIFGGIDTGWTFYTPFSTMFSNTLVVPGAAAVFITGFSSILTGLNFIVTIHTMRAPGMTWFRLPLFVWSLYATSLIMVLGTPVLAIALLLVAAERLLQVGVFDPALGGDPILFQHLFWFYSHPAVYIMVLPGMGVVSEIIPCFARRPIFGYRFIAFSSIGIAVLGFLVWGHHMFVSGQSMYAGLVFSVLSFLVAVPSAIKVFNWTATLYKGSIQFDTPMLYALGFIGLFTLGGLTGLMLASLAIDVHVHDTYFVVAHFHYIMVGGAVMAYLGGMHFWWPKISGRMYSELLGKLSALTVFIGFNLTFFPQFVLGYLGMPRRYYEYPDEYQVLNVMSTAGASILAVGYALPLIYLLFTLRNPPNAGPNPWRATGLEWQTASPPPVHNFDRPPVVTAQPYAYSPQATEGTDEYSGGSSA